MTSVSSYDPARTTTGALPGELARLEAQAALTFTEELHLLRELGLGELGLGELGPGGPGPGGPGRGGPRLGATAADSDRRWPLVEVGAGTGALSRRLAAALPDAAVIALDADVGLLGYLQRSATAPAVCSDARALPPAAGPVPAVAVCRDARALPPAVGADCVVGSAGADCVVGADCADRAVGSAGAVAVCGDARALPLADGAASAVIFRYVLQHVSDPAQVLREARRVLRPGGRVYVIEVDGGLWGLVEPVDPGLASVYARAGAAQRDAGGDRLIGRKLSGLLRSAGFTDVTVRPFAVTNDHRHIDDFEPHLGPSRLVPLVEDGTLSLADLALATTAWKRLRADSRAWVMLVGLIAAGLT